MILVDYRCPSCRGRIEHFVASPPPDDVRCPACGGRARRCYSPVGLTGVATAPSAGSDPAPSCRDYPDVPGLCHMTPAAARAWVARARGDNRRLDRELERQERTLREYGRPADEPVHHDHGHGHGHDRRPHRVPAQGEPAQATPR